MADRYIYPEPLIEEIISKNDIVDTISRYVKIDRKGKDYFGLCPFHKEKTPSFSVVPAKQIYYCFGCNKGGNVINFIKDIENLDYAEAVRLLAERANINIPQKNSYVDEATLKKEKRTYEMNSIAARFFFDCLKSKENPEPLHYLINRKIEKDTIVSFGIGYAPNDWTKLTEFLKKKGFSEAEIIEAGLGSKSKNGTIDKFRNRIMFPIIDIRNRVIGFGGRALDDKDVKYMNSPETCVYKKSKSLFSMNFAKNSREDYVIIVEGYMDCISLHQAGFTNTIASLGTALTDNQAKLIKRIFGQAVIAYDNDSAGQNASLRGLDMLANMGCVVKVLILPKEDKHGRSIKDPDDFIKYKGKDEFKQAIKKSLMLVEYKAQLLRSSCDLNTSEGQIAFLKGVASAIGQVESPVERDVYIKNISARFNTSYDALLKEVQNRTKDDSDTQYNQIKAKPVTKIASSLRDRYTEKKLDKIFYSILVLLCNNPGFKDEIRKELIEAGMTHNDFSKELLEEILNKYDSMESPDEAKISAMLDDEQRSVFIKEAAEYHTISDPNKALSDYITRYRHDIIVNNNIVLSKALVSEGVTEEEKEKLKDELRRNTALLGKYKISG
ncbi:MAG: DNA primase [Clostridiaceae bacterium]|nr:DNA primase [Clostridiaceae bacterium]